MGESCQVSWAVKLHLYNIIKKYRDSMSTLPTIWILGGPGSGKGSQCDNIVAKFGYTHLSSGELLRSEVLSGSGKGKQLYTTMSAGSLVPDEEVVELIKSTMTAKSADTK